MNTVSPVAGFQEPAGKVIVSRIHPGGAATVEGGIPDIIPYGENDFLLGIGAVNDPVDQRYRPPAGLLGKHGVALIRRGGS